MWLEVDCVHWEERRGHSLVVSRAEGVLGGEERAHSRVVSRAEGVLGREERAHSRVVSELMVISSETSSPGCRANLL